MTICTACGQVEPAEQPRQPLPKVTQLETEFDSGYEAGIRDAAQIAQTAAARREPASTVLATLVRELNAMKDGIRP